MIDFEKVLYNLCEPIVSDALNLSVKRMETLDENEICLYVYANSDDVARLIGKKGIVAEAIREVVNASAKLNSKKIKLKFEVKK